MPEYKKIPYVGRPAYPNPDGSHSTAITRAIGPSPKDGYYYNIPMLVGGQRLNEAEADANFHRTGEYFDRQKSLEVLLANDKKAHQEDEAHAALQEALYGQVVSPNRLEAILRGEK